MFLRLDVVDARDVQEVILVIVRQKPFHLRRVHAAVGLADINHRQIQAGEDVDGHLPNRQDAAPGRSATRATTTVSGRRNAKRIRFIRCTLPRWPNSILTQRKARETSYGPRFGLVTYLHRVHLINTDLGSKIPPVEQCGLND